MTDDNEKVVQKSGKVISFVKQAVQRVLGIAIGIAAIAIVSIAISAIEEYREYANIFGPAGSLTVLVSGPLYQFAILDVADGPFSVNTVFEEDSDGREWTRFLELWRRARSKGSLAHPAVESMHDTTLTNQTTTYLISDGKRLRIVLREGEACAAIDLDEQQVNSAERAFAQVTADLAGQPTKPIEVIPSPGLVAATNAMRDQFSPARPNGRCSLLLGAHVSNSVTIQ